MRCDRCGATVEQGEGVTRVVNKRIDGGTATKYGPSTKLVQIFLCFDCNRHHNRMWRAFYLGLIFLVVGLLVLIGRIESQ
jgi:hypothetical protein